MVFGSWSLNSQSKLSEPISKQNRKPRNSDNHVGHDKFAGLRNSSGAHCFLNSTLQSLASLEELEHFLETILIESDELDLYLPISEALWDIIQTLNTPRSSRSIHTNTSIINAFNQPTLTQSNTMNPAKRALSLIRSGQQDAQEIFQCISSLLAQEHSAIQSKKKRTQGLELLLIDSSNKLKSNDYCESNPFIGLNASRLADIKCGYVEAIRNFTFDCLSLNLPMQTSCTLDRLLLDYATLELIEDAACRKCSLESTLNKLRLELEKVKPPPNCTKSDLSTHKRKKLKELTKIEKRLSGILEEKADFESDVRLNGIKIDRVSSGSTKQVLISRPPRILALHINRSAYFGNGMAFKNPCKILFGDILDLTPVTTSGTLETEARKPISSLSGELFKKLAIEGQLPNDNERVLYRLKSIIVHYGSHSSGHYVTYRRQSKLKGDEDDEWIRASDERVERVGLSEVLMENPFMIFYERSLNNDNSIENNNQAKTRGNVLTNYELYN